ncbi:MAG: AEC family transporter, partial [Clostridia bacterium]|nr:AEC family transporter [Clostridia bacterium]
GDTGIAGIISAFSIPVFNVLAVVALSKFAENEEKALTEASLYANANGEQIDATPIARPKKKLNVKSILLNIVKNPLIIGVVVGLAFVGVREIERACTGGNVPFRFNTHLKFLYTCVSDLKAIASPLALVVLGGQFEFSAVKGMTKEIIIGTAWRIVVAPLLGIGVAFLFSKYTNAFTFGPEIYPTLIALFGTPVAVSSAIMAGQMGSDEQLATQLVVWTSICSILTIFVMVFLLMSFGLVVV